MDQIVPQNRRVSNEEPCEFRARIEFRTVADLLFHLRDADQLHFRFWNEYVSVDQSYGGSVNDGHAVVPVIDFTDDQRIVGAATWRCSPSVYVWLFFGRISITQCHFLDEFVPLTKTREGWAIAGERDPYHAACRKEQWVRFNSEPGFDRDEALIERFVECFGSGVGR